MPIKKKRPTSKKNDEPAKPEQPWETLMRLMKPPITPGKAAGWGLFLMLFGGPLGAAGNTFNVGWATAVGSLCFGLGAISLLIGILWGLGLINPKKDFK